MGGRGARSCWLLLALSLEGILAGDWSVDLPSGPICAVIGSSVVLPCSYDYPRSWNESRGTEGRLPAQGGGGEEEQYKVLSEMWCREDRRCLTQRYVFHSAGVFPDASYQNRVQYLGQAGTKNCSLRISDLRASDSGTYVFYLITTHPTQKMPGQRGAQLLVADSSSAVAMSGSPSGGVAEGEALRLACCSPSAGPQARFRWFHSASSAPRHDGRVWDIGDASSDDSGSYYCQMQTGDGVRNSTTLAIDVEYSPRNTVVSISPAGEPERGLPATLTCSSDANPPVHTYAWYRGAACLPTADKSFHQATRSPATTAGGGSTISSADVSAEEYGQHCCVARNAHGSQTYSVTLTDTRASTSTGSRVLLIAVIVCVLLAILAIVAFFMRRRQKKKSQHQSYVLTATNATEP